MCSIFFACNHHPEYKLVVAANRDEFYARPTEPSKFHGSDATVLSGLDKLAGGSWMGMTKAGKFTALTNYRDMSKIMNDAPSRGELVADYLKNNMDPQQFYNSFKESSESYNQFNILLGNFKELFYYSNIRHLFQKLDPGVYGLSNHLLNTPWPKVEKGRIYLQHLLNNSPANEWVDSLFSLLEDREQASDSKLPDTGVGRKLERILSPIFIVSDEYGTRTSTILLVKRSGEVTWVEKTFHKGKYHSRVDFSFKLELNPEGID